MSNDKPFYLGINAVYHESSAAVLRENEVIAAVEEERLSRIKHAKRATIDNSIILPFASIDFCLERAGISFDDLAGIGYSFSPRLRWRHNRSCPSPKPLPPFSFGTEDGEQRFAGLNSLVPTIIEERYGVSLDGRFSFLPHHKCHLASAFYSSPYSEAALLSIDGIGEWASTAIAKGSPSGLSVLHEHVYPDSLGFLWEKMTAFLGFRPNSDECKVMGLASFGDAAVFRSAFRKFVTVGDGEFHIDDSTALLRHCDDFSKLEEFLGQRRLPHEVLEYKGKSSRHADIAAALQELTNEILLTLARKASELTGSRFLCLAGGVALNCVANGELAVKSPFNNIWVHPAANDAGTALGAAYLCSYSDGRRRNRISGFEPFTGPAFGSNDIDRALDTFRLADRVVAKGLDGLFDKVARRIADGKIVGWFQGRMEWGPRALGNRSILADPRKRAMVDILNSKVKHREQFRPFCPSVLAEEAEDWFDFASRPPVDAADYMLVAYPVRPEKMQEIQAVVHVDGTSRLQLVHKDRRPRYYALIEAFRRLTGIPMLLNTSFNDREPIVCSPDEAVSTFLSTGLDCLVLGDTLIDK